MASAGTAPSASAPAAVADVDSAGQQKKSPMEGLLQTLSQSVVYLPNTDNVSTNRKLWDAYAADWSAKPEWLATMAQNVGTDATALAKIGEEWSSEADLQRTLETYVLPYLRPDSRVLEIGSGGGRLTTRLLPHVPRGSWTCADVSKGMLGACTKAVQAMDPAPTATLSFLHIPPGEEGGMDLSVLDGQGPWDFILIFDVLVHCGLKQLWCYACRMGQAGGAGGATSGGARPSWLAPGGRAFLSTSNMCAPLGWQRFSAQKKETVGGFVWTSPQAVDMVVGQAGLEVVVRSWPRPAQAQEAAAGEGAAAPSPAPTPPSVRTMYEERDYLLVVGQPAA